jgi:PAS domain-containing protein
METAVQNELPMFVDNIPALCWMADKTGYIYWYNEKWFSYTGTNIEQMQGWGWTEVHDPYWLPKVMKEWTSCIASGVSFEMTFPLRGADGVFRMFLTRVAPMKKEGVVTGWFGVNSQMI